MDFPFYFSSVMSSIQLPCWFFYAKHSEPFFRQLSIKFRFTSQLKKYNPCDLCRETQSTDWPAARTSLEKIALARNVDKILAVVQSCDHSDSQQRCARHEHDLLGGFNKRLYLLWVVSCDNACCRIDCQTTSLLTRFSSGSRQAVVVIRVRHVAN